MARFSPEQWQQIEAWFDELRPLPPEKWSLALAEVDDAAVVAEVRALLVANLKQGDFLERSSPPLQTRPDVVEPGTRIGAWQIIGLLGRGGMGAVYRAARADGQFQQEAALKLARVETLARPEQFHNERQILATLEHPGIARLIDGGLTGDGYPYMVMELVDGQNLFDYCIQGKLDLAARLALFGQVCGAVGYAHRHLVVHRDLKPSNIFVTADGRVKLLDFGIAKLLDAGHRSDIGTTTALMTPDYAAPEQLEGRPTTTATDVFALGLLLYELLTGAPPWNLRELPLPAALQRLLNTDARRPSVAAAESATPPVPVALLRGDLDAIVLKALRREPEERYASASEFWDDVQRHLAYQPVLARGSARSYFVRRFVRRYRVLVAATAAVFLALIIGFAGTVWEAHRVLQERNLFEAQDSRSKAVNDYLALMLRAGGKNAEGQPISLRDLLEESAKHLDQQFADRPADYAAVVVFFGDLYSALEDEQSAVSMEQAFIDSPAAAAVPETAADIRVTLAQSRLRQGDFKTASATLSPAQVFWQSNLQLYRGKLARSRIIEGQIVKASGDLPGAIAVYRRGLEEIEGAPGVVPEDTSSLETSLGIALMQSGEFDEADRLMQRARDFWESQGRITETLLVIIQNQGNFAMARGDYPRAEVLLRQSIDQRRKNFGPSGALASAEGLLSKVLLHQKHFQEALNILAEARPMAVQYIGPDSPVVLGIDISTAEAQINLGEFGTAAPLVDEVLQRAAKIFSEHHPFYASGLILKARLRLADGRLSDARQLADQAGEILSKAGPLGRPQQSALDALNAEIVSRGG